MTLLLSDIVKDQRYHVTSSLISTHNSLWCLSFLRRQNLTVLWPGGFLSGPCPTTLHWWTWLVHYHLPVFNRPCWVTTLQLSLSQLQTNLSFRSQWGSIFSIQITKHQLPACLCPLTENKHYEINGQCPSSLSLIKEMSKYFIPRNQEVQTYLILYIFIA